MKITTYLNNKMINFKTAFMAIIWSEILLQFNSVSKYIQKAKTGFRIVS